MLNSFGNFDQNTRRMLGFLKSKSPKEKLEAQYKKLLSEAHKLSQINRSAGDAKYAEAEEVLDKIKSLEANS